MTWLLRKVTSIKDWVAFEVPTGHFDAPVWAVREFVPSDRDQGEVSVFEIANANEALVIAGAWAFNFYDGLDKGQTFFVAAEMQSLVEDGIEVKPSPGRLRHAFADACHRVAVVRDLGILNRVACHFLRSNQAYSFEGKNVGASARNSAEQNMLSYEQIHQKKFETNWAGKNLLGLIGSRNLEVRGVADAV